MERVVSEMMAFYAGEPRQIQHFTKVHGFARWIGLGEGLDGGTLEILEIAALVHDIGIRPALEKYGAADGRQQETEGPPLAAAMLRRLGYRPAVVDRVCYLVGHHHSYEGIEGADYQILVEADFLVNMFEGDMSRDAIRSVYKRIFRTQTGKRYCERMFALEV